MRKPTHGFQRQARQFSADAVAFPFQPDAQSVLRRAGLFELFVLGSDQPHNLCPARVGLGVDRLPISDPPDGLPFQLREFLLQRRTRLLMRVRRLPDDSQDAIDFGAERVVLFGEHRTLCQLELYPAALALPFGFDGHVVNGFSDFRNHSHETIPQFQSHSLGFLFTRILRSAT